MAILVTGAAGFIGSHLCERLVFATKHEVLGVDNFDGFYPKALKQRNIARLLRQRRFHFLPLDVRSTRQMQTALAEYRVTSVVHLAGRGGVAPSIKRPLQYLHANVTGTVALLESCKAASIHTFINATSSSVYGEIGRQMCGEARNTDRPASIYAASKKCSEVLAHAYYALYQMPIVNVRLFSVYGPRGRPDQVVYRITRAVDEGREIRWIEPEPVRDFTYIDDIVDGLMAILAAAPCSYHTINFGCGVPQPVGRVLSLVEQALGKKARLKRESEARQCYDVSASHANVALAARLFGWTPKTMLADGVPKFVTWYLNERLSREKT